MPWAIKPPATEDEFRRLIHDEINHLAAFLKGRETDGAYPHAVTIALASVLAQASVQFAEQQGMCAHENLTRLISLMISNVNTIEGMSHEERAATDRARTH